MIEDNMTNEQKSNLDNLNYFYETKKETHVKLLRTDHHGRHIFLNGYIVSKFSDTLFIMEERVLGEIRLSIFEIRINGVEEARQ